MTETPRRIIAAALLSRASTLLEERDWSASLAAGILAKTFAESDTLYDGQYMLSGDHKLNAAIDAAAMSVTQHIFATCNYKGLAARCTTTTREALDAAWDQVSANAQAS